jgi:hypothetical protein
MDAATQAPRDGFTAFSGKTSTRGCKARGVSRHQNTTMLRELITRHKPEPSFMRDQRRHQRIPIKVQIKIWRDDMEPIVINTRDISDGGLFLITDPVKMPPIGTLLSGQVQHLEDAPIVDMEIVRVEPGGLGLKFVGL